MTHSADRRSHSSWRSTGWASLKYPLPAIVTAAATSPRKISGPGGDKSIMETNSEDTCGTTTSNSSAHENLNQFFPLHGDVMLACVRELLILDGSIDKKTLEVVYKPTCIDAENGGTKKEESMEEPDANSQSLGHGGDTSSLQFLRHTRMMMPEESRRSRHNPKMPLLVAEDIANEILQGTVQRDDPRSTRSRECHSEASSTTGTTTTTSDVTTKPPRKVSDANFTDDMGASLSTSSGNVNTSLGLPPAMFALVASGHHVSPSDNNKSQLIFGDQLPNLVHISISAENHLRAAARILVETMTSSFEDRPLRQFLGYRSNTKSSPKRHQLVEGIASFLFDVSHATFAFEAELAGMDRAAAMSGSLDHKVCGLLFDDRSLRGIGGFDSSSLLRHALSIGRSRAKNQPWKAFAKSAYGRNMLRHHWSGNATALVGQKRRRNRPRSRSSGMLDDEQGGKRSRSSSVSSHASTTTMDESQDRQVNRLAPPSAEATVEGIVTPPFGAIPDVVSVTIEREIGCSWGVSLANEGDMCIVQRVSRIVPNGLKVGDMVVSAKTPEGMCVRLASLPPADHYAQYTCNVGSVIPEDHSEQKQSFYRRIVNLFKEGNGSTLIVEVMRVGGGIVALG